MNRVVPRKIDLDSYYNPVDLRIIYGEITSVEMRGYWKYEFSLVVKTTTEYYLRVITGGSAEGIYMYNPLETTWSEHTSSYIRELCILPETRIKRCLAFLGCKLPLSPDVRRLLCLYMLKMPEYTVQSS